jgi:hypothetical protein
MKMLMMSRSPMSDLDMEISFAERGKQKLPRRKRQNQYLFIGTNIPVWINFFTKLILYI